MENFKNKDSNVELLREDIVLLVKIIESQKNLIVASRLRAENARLTGKTDIVEKFEEQTRIREKELESMENELKGLQAGDIQ